MTRWQRYDLLARVQVEKHNIRRRLRQMGWRDILGALVQRLLVGQ